MKKSIYFLAFTILLLHACSSSEDNTVNSPSLILCKKIIETDPEGVYTSNYTYDGNKITNATILINLNNGASGEINGFYTYDGDLIEQIELFLNNILVEKRIYNYSQNSQLSSFKILDYNNNTGTKMVYTHNANGTISSIEYSGDLSNQNTVVSNNLLTFSNGEVFSFVENFGAITRTSTYSYDNKNTPLKNVLGADKISFSGPGLVTSEINHNLIQRNTVQSGAPSSILNIEYTYNSDNFPTTKAEIFNGFTDRTYEYFY